MQALERSGSEYPTYVDLSATASEQQELLEAEPLNSERLEQGLRESERHAWERYELERYVQERYVPERHELERYVPELQELERHELEHYVQGSLDAVIETLGPFALGHERPD